MVITMSDFHFHLQLHWLGILILLFLWGMSMNCLWVSRSWPVPGRKPKSLGWPMLMSRQVRKENHRCSNSRSEMVFWKNVAIALGLSLAGVKAFPQADTVSRFSFSTYAELYYSYDFNNPSD